MDTYRLIDNIVARCTEVSMEPMVGYDIFDPENIDKLLKHFRKALLSEYEAHTKQMVDEGIEY